MNSPRETLGPVESKERRHVLLSDLIPHMTITTGHIAVPDGNTDNWVYLTQAEAIRAAEAILIAYDVPFCNRVEGAGVNNG